jgi:hypothetical protein
MGGLGMNPRRIGGATLADRYVRTMVADCCCDRPRVLWFACHTGHRAATAQMSVMAAIEGFSPA